MICIILLTISIIIIIIITLKTAQIKKTERFTDKLKQEWINHAFWTTNLGILIMGNADLDNIKTTVAKIGQVENNIIDLIISESLKDKKIKIDRELIKTQLIETLNKHILLISESLYNIKNDKTEDQSNIANSIKNNNDKFGMLLSKLSSWITINKSRDLFSDYIDNIMAQFVSYKNKNWETSMYVNNDVMKSAILFSNYISNALEY